MDRGCGNCGIDCGDFPVDPSEAEKKIRRRLHFVTNVGVPSIAIGGDIVINSRFPGLCKRVCVFICAVLLMLSMVGCNETEWGELPDRIAPPGFETRATPEIYNKDFMIRWGVDLDTFITADMLSDYFGELNSFCFNWLLSDPEERQLPLEDILGDYQYSFSVKCPKHETHYIALHIQNRAATKRGSRPEPLYISERGAQDSMAFSENDGWYRLGNVEYRYFDGLLYRIYWSSGNYTFDLYLDEFIGDECWFREERGFIAQLLREETAEDAVEEFNRDISRALFWGKVQRNWLPWVVPMVIVVLSVVTFLLIRRRRKRKAGASVLLEETSVEPDTDPGDSDTDTE